jgi:hypothetical protein
MREKEERCVFEGLHEK